MTSSSTSRPPRPLPVPVARNSFRIDDILGTIETGRDETARGKEEEKACGLPTLRLTSDDISLRQHCLLYTSPSPRDRTRSRMPSSA